MIDLTSYPDFNYDYNYNFNELSPQLANTTFTTLTKTRRPLSSNVATLMVLAKILFSLLML